MGIPINGGNKVYYLAVPGTPQHAMVERTITGYRETLATISARLTTLREAMDLPVWHGFLLTHKGAKVENLEMVFNTTKEARAVDERIDAVNGRHGIKFRKKTEPYKQMLALLDGCPPMPQFQSRLMGELTGKTGACGGPGVLEHPDGRYALHVGTSMDLDGWVEIFAKAGFQTLTHPEFLRFQADVEEAKAAKAKAPA